MQCSDFERPCLPSKFDVNPCYSNNVSCVCVLYSYSCDTLTLVNAMLMYGIALMRPWLFE